MREITAFAGLQQLLLEEEEPRSGGPAFELSPEDRVAFLCHDLLTLGVALRDELPDPVAFLHVAATAASEVAQLVARPGTATAEAVDRLTAYQRERFEGHGRAGDWKCRGPEVHLARAFWQLAGVAREIAKRPATDGQLEEHAADLANYLLFAAVSSGAWELAHRKSAPESQAPDPSCRRGNSPAPVSP